MASDTLKVATIFQPDSISGKDAIIESISPNENYSSTPFLSVFAWTDSGKFNFARTLIQFDLSKISNTTIKSASLSLYFSAYDNLNAQTGENSFTIYRISQSWDPGTVTWNNQPSYSVLDSVVIPKSKIEKQSYVNIDVTGLVKDMISYPAESFGFLLKLNNQFPYGLVICGSSKNIDKQKHPKLLIYY